MNRQIQLKIFFALLLTVPIALLFMMADAFGPTSASANVDETFVELSSPAGKVGYGVRAVRLHVGKTKFRKAAGRRHTATDLMVADPEVATATFERKRRTTLVAITGQSPGTTTVSWKVRGTTVKLKVIVVERKDKPKKDEGGEGDDEDEDGDGNDEGDGDGGGHEGEGEGDGKHDRGKGDRRGFLSRFIGWFS